MQCIDFYVPVIDNYGDMGFAVNLALSLYEKYPDLRIRFFSDDSVLFHKFLGENIPEWIEYNSLDVLTRQDPPIPATLIYSFFDYKIPKEYLPRFPYEKTIVIFSYFLLHNGLGSLHGTTYMLESGYDRVIHFIPSCLREGWGIIINPMIERETEKVRKLWVWVLRKNFLSWIWRDVCEKRWISVFVYRETLEEILPVIENDTSGTVFWICGDIRWIPEMVNCRLLPFLSLEDYGVFQSLCDANVVRGENSLCQALLSGKPVLWDIYKESNSAHLEKIEDYLLFFSEQLPNVDLEGYQGMMRGFNEIGNRKRSFSDFISWYRGYEGLSGQIGEYIRRECDLVTKLEEIQKK